MDGLLKIELNFCADDEDDDSGDSEKDNQEDDDSKIFSLL